MNTIARFSRKIYAILTATILVMAFLVCAGVAPVNAGEGVSFSWRANPVEDEIVGYRLYYGNMSRFVAGNYDFYIDFTTLQRCPASNNGSECEPLPDDAVTCQDLFRDNPHCTVYDLQGSVYLAMTAYNAQTESDYTQELNYISSEVVVGLQAVYGLLLK